MSAQGSAGGPSPVRKATEDDVGAVARIWYTGWADGHAGNVPAELVRHRHQEQFRTRARDRLDGTWVAGSGRQPTGFVMVVDDEVEQIYVDGAARGTGVAAALLHHAEDEIRRAGHRRAWLAVVAGNERARAFYSRLGWRDAGPFTYLAETADGPIEVPCQRYEIQLTDEISGNR